MKTFLSILAVIAFATIAFFVFKGSSTTASEDLFASAKKGNFEVLVNSTGELKAKNSIKIRGPEEMRTVGIWQTSIKELIPEGTMVKKGDFVASLEKSELAGKITENQTNLEKEQTRLEQIQIDTAIQMKQVRDEISNLKFNMEQEKLEIEKNKYEPQMVIEQSQLKLQKSLRDLDQLKNKMELLKIQADAQVREIQANIKQINRKLENLMDVSKKFTITAPDEGMLIYQKTWNGKKGPGSQVSGWDPVVAELPDLTNMISVAYINEVDISKVKKGQKVKIKVDAFPEKEFDGQIISVANIGQQLRNQEAKVFDITIQINQTDEVLKPSMTTSNQILVYEYEDVVNIPLECFFSDSLDYVFKKTGSGLVKQEVVKGAANEDNVIIVSGLEADDVLAMNAPENEASLKIVSLGAEEKEEAEKMLAHWKEEKAKYDKENEDLVKTAEVKRDFDTAGGVIFIN